MSESHPTRLFIIAAPVDAGGRSNFPAKKSGDLPRAIIGLTDFEGNFVLGPRSGNGAIDGHRPWSVFSAPVVIVRMIVRMVSNSIGRQAMATVKCPKCPATVTVQTPIRYSCSPLGTALNERISTQAPKYPDVYNARTY